MRTKLFFLAMIALSVSGCGKKSVVSPEISPGSHVSSLQEIAADIQKLPLASSTGMIVDRGYTVSYESRQAAGTPNSLRFTSPNGNLADLPASVAATLNDYVHTRHVTSLDMPVDGKDPNLIYLSTSRPLNEHSTVTENEVYRYDLIKRELVSLYKEQATNGTLLRTVGRDGTQIVILRDSVSASPGPCTELWYDFQYQMMVFDTAHPEHGLERYAVPQKRAEEARRAEESCLKAMQ